MDSARDAVAPHLDPDVRPGPPRAKYALLINPFYPKDPHASFGKHVLTPSLALDEHRRGDPDATGRSLTGTKTCCKARRRGIRFRRSSGSRCT